MAYAVVSVVLCCSVPAVFSVLFLFVLKSVVVLSLPCNQAKKTPNKDPKEASKDPEKAFMAVSI